MVGSQVDDHRSTLAVPCPAPPDGPGELAGATVREGKEEDVHPVQSRSRIAQPWQVSMDVSQPLPGRAGAEDRPDPERRMRGEQPQQLTAGVPGSANDPCHLTHLQNYTKL